MFLEVQPWRCPPGVRVVRRAELQGTVWASVVAALPRASASTWELEWGDHGAPPSHPKDPASCS